ncbi:hypothetical protein BA065_02165 [Nanoarchaeota archaeon NZ13-N]|nr:MAG: hypothetical protein BA065_02165 [Nanoarchaeota archaeon NZ13-N]
MRKMLLIPSTFTGEKRDKKIRIFLISQVARAAVTFGINEVCIYYDPDPKFDSHGLGRFLVKVLKYLNTLLLEKLRKEGFYIIGTSRLGEDIRKINLRKSEKVAIAFGSFARGFEDMFGNKFREMFDITINVVPNQLIYSIRTEEAIFYTLAVLRYRDII